MKNRKKVFFGTALLGLATTLLIAATTSIKSAEPQTINGLKAEYFNNQDFTDLALTRNDDNIDFDWGTRSPYATIETDTFSVRWTGQIEPRYSETYTFQTYSDDGIRLWVNDQLIIDQLVPQSPTLHSGTISLEAGQRYTIRVDYIEIDGGAHAELMWSSDSQSHEKVPQAVLFSTAVPKAEAPGPGPLYREAIDPGEQVALDIDRVFTTQNNVIALKIKTGNITRGKQVDYRPQPNDKIDDEGWVTRDNKTLGWRVTGEPNKIWLVDQYSGPELNTAWADNLSNYEIVAANGSTMQPTNVYRKSKVDNMAQIDVWDFRWPMEHTVYLELPENLAEGDTYQLNFAGKFLKNTDFVYTPKTTRSDAVQVSHIGFAPDDGWKVAFLSTWMGNGGGLDYAADMPFGLIDTATGKQVYQGTSTLSKAADEADDNFGRNHSDTDVFMLNFSDFNTPGRYVVYVDGVGTSYEFEIGDNTWKDAFYVSVRGLFHQRSGIELAQPYTDYRRPRSFHPDDGVKVYQSTVPLMDTDMGLSGGLEAFESLQKTRTDKVVADAWGGWMDAGDWDRRTPHLEVSRSMLELVELHGDYFKSVNLNIPESNNNLPDVLDEALWGLDVFRRLQQADGGVSGGIESAGHPVWFEGSWQESQMIMAYGPGIWSSYYYAGVAARAAYVLKAYDAGLARTYEASALKAMAWANAELAKAPDDRYHQIYDQRNLAAAELYRLTGDAQWHNLFLETTIYSDPDVKPYIWEQHDHLQAAFVYGRTDGPVNKTIQKNAITAITREANQQISVMNSTGYKWNLDPESPIGWGDGFGAPRTDILLRAHALTGNRRYLDASVLASQFSAGANPDNMAYTTGIGYNNPDMPLIADMQATGQAPPPGITVYGPIDLQNSNGYGSDWSWAIDLFSTDDSSPTPWEFPTAEAYFDSFYYVPVTEFTISQSIGPTAYTWGYLAAADQAEAAGPKGEQ